MPSLQTDARQDLLIVYLTEYKAMRNEMEVHMGFQNQVTGYSVGIVGAVTTLIALSPSLINIDHPELLLVASVLLSTLTWAYIHSTMYIIDISRYFSKVLAPNISRVIPGRYSKESILGWDKFNLTSSFRRVAKGILSLGKISVSLLSSIVFFSIYYLTRMPLSNPIESFELVLFWFATIALFIPLLGTFANFLAARQIMKNK